MDLVTLARNSFKRFVPEAIQGKLKKPAKRVLYFAERTRLHGLRDMPMAVEIETNTLCTRACEYCPRPENSEQRLEDSVFYSVVDQLADWGFRGRFSPHSYNEPLTDKRIVQFIAYARLKLPESNIVLYTNGDLLDEETIDKLTLSGVDTIRISLHNPLAVEREAEFQKYEEKYGNISLADYRKGKRTKGIGNRGGLLVFDNTTYIDFCCNIYTLVIRSNGNVVLCGDDALQRYVFGNVLTKSISDIWLNSELREARKRIAKGDFFLESCASCGYMD